MSEEQEITQKAGGLLPEVYYDIIGRVIPGAIILGLYGYPYIPKPYTSMVFLGCIISAYIFGLAVDVCMGILFDRIPYFNKPRKIS